MIAAAVFFGTIALVIVGSAAGMLVTRNAVYSALLLVLNFATVALLYLVLGAPFISLVQITVYAGSIMVLFLFVIMLLGAERLSAREPITGQRTMAFALGGVFLLEVVLFFLVRTDITAIISPQGVNAGSPADVGRLLFTQYALPFEITGFLLLVATMGAILLTRGEERIQRHSSTLRFAQKKRD